MPGRNTQKDPVLPFPAFLSKPSLQWRARGPAGTSWGSSGESWCPSSSHRGITREEEPPLWGQKGQGLGSAPSDVSIQHLSWCQYGKVGSWGCHEGEQEGRGGGMLRIYQAQALPSRRKGQGEKDEYHRHPNPLVQGRLGRQVTLPLVYVNPLKRPLLPSLGKKAFCPRHCVGVLASAPSLGPSPPPVWLLGLP